MTHIKIVTPDPDVEKLLHYLAAELPESVEPVVLLDAAQMERIPEFSGTKAILFSASADPQYLAAARNAGAAGFWYLEPSADSLSRVLMGQPAFPEEAPAVKLGKISSAVLTHREIDVLRQLTLGKSDADIAAALHCSLSTVKHYVSSMREKTGISSRVTLAVLAATGGLIDISWKTITNCNNYTFDQ